MTNTKTRVDEDEVCELNYRKHVATIARLLVAEEPENAWDACAEAAASSRWVIYHFRAQSLLLWSKNANACFECDTDWADGAQSIQELATKAAYFALTHDLLDAVRTLQAERNEA